MEKSLEITGMVTSVDVPERWLSKRNAMLTKATATQSVATQIEFDDGSELLNSITKHSNELEKQRKEFAAPFTAAAKSIKRMCDDERVNLEAEKSRIKMLLSRYAAEQAQKQLQERRRIEAVERAKAERLFEEQQKAQAEADLLGLESAPEEIKIEHEPEPYVEQAHSQSSKILQRVVWFFEDEDLIPKAFLMVDNRKINEYIRNTKEEIKRNIEGGGDGKNFVAGIRFELKTDVIGR